MTERAWRWLVLVPVATLYFVALPRSVQTLDTGDMVASAHRLWLAHPPGYPLYTWLVHVFDAVVPLSSPFWRASLFTALCVLGGVAFLVALTRSWLGALVVAVLATLPVVWMYAVLPDVFGLHVLCSCALLYAALAARVHYRELWVCLAFGLGAANHQTIIFLAPIVIMVSIRGRSWRRSAVAVVCGAFVTVALYASLLALHTDAWQSWRQLSSLGDVVQHFLRSDYGTFQLSGQTGARASVAESGAAFARAAWPLVVAALVVLSVARPQRWQWVVGGCAALYVVCFFPLMNLGDPYMTAVVRERFFIFPLVVLAALVCIVDVRIERRALAICLGGLLVTLVVANVADGMELLRLPDDTVVEDYARNVIDLAAASASATARPTFVLVDGDTKCSATHYVQAIDGDRGITVLCVGRADGRLKSRLTVDTRAQGEDPAKWLMRAVVPLNLEHDTFVSTLKQTEDGFRRVYEVIGRRLEPGEGVSFADPSLTLRLHPPVYAADSEGYLETRALYNEYADYWEARATAQSDAGAAVRDFKQCLAIVPWRVPCREKLCALERAMGASDPECPGGY